MHDMQFLAMMANEGFELFTVVYTHALIPLLHANLKAMSLMTALSVVTFIYPFHRVADCVNSTTRLECMATALLLGANSTNITHTILMVDRNIQSAAMILTESAANLTHATVERAKESAANLTHAAMERAKARWSNASSLFIIHQK